MRIGKHLGGRVFEVIEYIRSSNRHLVLNKLLYLVYNNCCIETQGIIDSVIREIRFGSNPFRQLWR